MQRQNTLNLLHTLSSRATLFSFVYYIFLFLLYLIGNYQYFLDSTQVFILGILNIFLILHCLFGIYYLFFTIILSVRNRKIDLKYFILCTVSVAFALVLLFSIKVLDALM